MKLALGDIAKDTVTGFQGVVIGRTKYLYNVDRVTIQPRELRDGKRIDSRSFDEPGVEFVSHSEVLPTRPLADRFEVGDIVREKVTRFEGMVIARTLWISGCFTLTVQPLGLNKDGEPYEAKAFEEPECDLVKSGKQKKPERKVGGPKPEPRKPR